MLGSLCAPLAVSVSLFLRLPYLWFQALDLSRQGVGMGGGVEEGCLFQPREGLPLRNRIPASSPKDGLSMPAQWPTLLLSGRKPSLRAFELPRKLVPSWAELKFNSPPSHHQPVSGSFPLAVKTFNTAETMRQRRKG